jgi:hypothetical protein
VDSKQRHEASVARQWLSKHFPATHATIGELLEGVFSLGSDPPQYYKQSSRPVVRPVRGICLILVLGFSWLKLNMWLQLVGLYHIEW